MKEKYLALKKLGLSDEEVAQGLDLSLPSLRRFKKKNGLSGVTVASHEVLLVLDQGGNTIMRGTRREIAEGMGWTLATVRSYKKRTNKGEYTPYQIISAGE